MTIWVTSGPGSPMVASSAMSNGLLGLRARVASRQDRPAIFTLNKEGRGNKAALPILGGFVAHLEAVVGRPLTPVSVSGVARRTARRCSAGVYDC